MRYIFLFLTLTAFADHPYFLPPSSWEITQPKVASLYVQVGFLGKGSTDFRPSISLSQEELEEGLTLKEYIKAVKQIHLNDRNQYRDLGKFSMKGGEGKLIEITSTNNWGTIKMLQAILIKNDKAYILTGAVIKEDFLKFQSEILQCFRTLEILPELWTPIADIEKRESLQALFNGLQTPEDLQELKNQISDCKELGPYWQFVALQEGHLKLQSEK